MAKYRKKKDASSDVIYAWHWCFNCTAWPKDNYEESEAKPEKGLCDECLDLNRLHKCKNATTELIVSSRTQIIR